MLKAYINKFKGILAIVLISFLSFSSISLYYSNHNLKVAINKAIAVNDNLKSENHSLISQIHAIEITRAGEREALELRLKNTVTNKNREIKLLTDLNGILSGGGNEENKKFLNTLIPNDIRRMLNTD